MKRMRVTAVLGLIAGLGLACADFQEGFEKGKSESMVEGFTEAGNKLQGMPASRAQKRLLRVCSLATDKAAAGELELIAGSVFMGELEAVIADGEVTDDEADTIVAKYEELTGETLPGRPGVKR